MAVVDLGHVRPQATLCVREVEEVVHVKEPPPHGPQMEGQTHGCDPPGEESQPRIHGAGGRDRHSDPAVSGVAGEFVAQRL